MTTFRNFLTISALALVFVFTLGSCKKDATADLPDLTSTENTNNGNQTTTARSMEDDMDEMDELCFAFVYPISVELPDGSLETANNDDELELIFENYYLANPTSNEDPMLVFPLNIIDEETGEEATLGDEEELYAVLEMCFDDEWEECFTINYPVTVIFPGGSTQSVNDDEELETAFYDWYEANPMSDEDPTLEFPIEVTDEEGEVFTVNDMDELEDLFEECFGYEEEEEYELCFDIVFPVTINFPDGSSVEVGDYEALDSIYIEWMENNPGATEFPTFAYPIQVEFEDGEIVDVNNEDELEELFEECEGGGDEWDECFTFNYPITLLFPDGTSAEVNSDDELEEAVWAWYDANPMSDEDPTLQFPVDVTTAEGDVLTINSEEELEELFEECFDCLVVNGGELATGSGQSALAAQVIKQHSKLVSAKAKKVGKKFAKK